MGRKQDYKATGEGPARRGEADLPGLTRANSALYNGT